MTNQTMIDYSLKGKSVVITGGGGGAKNLGRLIALDPVFSKIGLTTIEDIMPWVRLMVSEGGWMAGQTILVNGSYTTK